MCASLQPRHIVISIAAAVVALGVVTSAASALVVKEGHGPGQPALSGKGSGPWKKAGSQLRLVYGEFLQHEQQGKATPFSTSIPRVQLNKGMILIDATAVSEGAQLFADLKGLGLSRGARYGAMVSGWLPLGMLSRAVELNSLRSVSASLKPMTDAGLVTSEGVAAMRATPVQVQGFTGAGVTVGILSDSFDKSTKPTTTATQDIANGDLPAEGVAMLAEGDCSQMTCIDEGRAMAQIIHDVAPGASLAFHTAFNGMADFAQGIEELANAGATVIVDDVAYFAEPMFQDGIVAQAVDTVKNQGVAYFSAAGNSARRSYESPFVPANEHLFVQSCGLFGCQQEDRGMMHDFDPGPGVSYKQSITVPEGTTLLLDLQWDQPFASVSPGPGSQSDVDIYLLDDNNTIVASATSDNLQSGDPVEILQYPLFSFLFSPGTYYLVITTFTGPQPDLLKYIVFPSYDITVNEYTTNSGTLFGHANAAGAEAVGAAYFMNTPAFNTSLTSAGLEYFSSAGPAPILFDTRGKRLSSPVIRNKPEIVAPDGVTTTFFYPGQDPDGDGKPNFFGTSAAAPHAAAIAALMRSANPTLSPAQIYNTIESTAAAMTTRCLSISCSTSTTTATEGYDFDTGAGLVQADLAVAAAASGGSGGSGGGTPTPTCTLTPNPSSIQQGDSVTLSWMTTNATSLSIDNGIGSVTPVEAGSTTNAPGASTTYTGTATGTGGTATCAASVTVTTPQAALNLSVDPPSIHLSRSGNGAPTFYQVGVTVSAPASSTVSLSAKGVPAQTSAVFEPKSISGSGTPTLTITVGPRGPRGVFTVTVTGTDQSNNQSSATLLLTIDK